MSLCNICNNNFVNRSNLVRHLTDKRCKGDLLKFNELIESQKKLIEDLMNTKEKLVKT